jgi:hypothetical protein
MKQYISNLSELSNGDMLSQVCSDKTVTDNTLKSKDICLEPKSEQKSQMSNNIKTNLSIITETKITNKNHIYIKTLDGKTLTIQIELSDTVHNLKVMILEREGIPVDRQRLIFSGTQLDDERNLSSYNIERMYYSFSFEITRRYL